MPVAEAQKAITTLDLPRGDPVYGPEGPLIEAWGVK
jgi:uncharacterized protein YjlB